MNPHFTALSSRVALFSLLFLFSISGFAQVTVTNFPKDNQLIARQGDARSVAYTIRGSVAAGTGQVRLSTKLRSGTTFIQEEIADIDARGNRAIDFEMTLSVPVTRANHRITLEDVGAANVLAEAVDVVAGDVYVVNGQSNAVASSTMAAVDRDPYLRGFLLNGDWSLLQLSYPGEWMGRAARVLSERHDVPIAVFNFAVGAQRLDFFMPQASGMGNFTESFNSLTDAEVIGRIAGYCWFQGEADGWEASIDSYERDLATLFDNYNQRFGVSRFYAFQTRTFSCTHAEPFVMEAQRRLNSSYDNLTVLSTTNAEHDGCHYPYETGYRLLGDRLADAVTRDQYGMGGVDVYSPNVDSARVTGDREITLYMDAAGAQMAVTGNPWAEFVAIGPEINPIGGSVNGNLVKLNFASSVRGASGITYLSHAGPAPDFLHNTRGVGAFTFYNVLLNRGDGDPGNLPDADLRFASEETELRPGGLFAVQVTLHNTGPTTLSSSVVTIPLPAPVLTYEGGNQWSATGGEFDVFSHRWFAPSIAPRDSAVLTLNYAVLQLGSPVTIWGEVSEQFPMDEDSGAGNATLGQVAEDDEARIVIGDRSRDCMLSIETVENDCPMDDPSNWQVALEGYDIISGDIALASPNVTVDQMTVGTRKEYTFDYTALAAANALPVRIMASRPGASGAFSCTQEIVVDVPTSCSGISGTRAFNEASISVYPNPIKSGEVLHFELPNAMQGVHATQVQLYDFTGREVPIQQLGGGSVQLGNIAPGLYMLRVGEAAVQVVVR